MLNMGDHDEHCQCALCEHIKSLESKDKFSVKMGKYSIISEDDEISHEEKLELIEKLRKEVSELEEEVDVEEEQKQGIFM